MSAELLIPPLLNSLVGDRVWYDATPDEGPPKDGYGRLMPFILLSVMGGQDQEYVDQTMGPMTNIRLRITAWTPATATVRTTGVAFAIVAVMLRDGGIVQLQACRHRQIE